MVRKKYTLCTVMITTEVVMLEQNDCLVQALLASAARLYSKRLVTLKKQKKNQHTSRCSLSSQESPTQSTGPVFILTQWPKAFGTLVYTFGPCTMCCGVLRPAGFEPGT